MKRYIAVYGGTRLDKNLSNFVKELSFSFLKEINNIALVTGGFHHIDKFQETMSTDDAVLEGARRFVNQYNYSLQDYFETWIPDPVKDRTDEAMVRFREGKVKEMKGKSAQARRFVLVQNVDAILTIKGKKHTSMVLDFAFAINKPAFPLPFTEGDSFSYWNDESNDTWREDNIEHIKNWFKLNDDFVNELKFIKPDVLQTDERHQLVKKIVDAVAMGIQRRCLILMAYDPEPTEFCQEVIEPAVIEMGFTPIVINQEINRGNIFEIFQERLRDSDAILADITEANPNVMYELGQAHAQHFPNVVLFSRKKLDDTTRKELPFYLSVDSIENSDVNTIEGSNYLVQRLKQHLEDIKYKIHKANL